MSLRRSMLTSIVALASLSVIVACQEASPLADTGEASFAVGFVQQPCHAGHDLQHVIARGAAIHSANGINVGPDDHVYVASVVGRRITELDPRSGRILRELGQESGVESPDDLVFGADGSLYWTAFLTGEIGKLSPSGIKSTVAVLGPGVNAITLSPDGSHLYVTKVFLGDALYDIDLTGASAPRLVASGLGGLNAMQVGPDGYLYGPLWFPGKVARVDVQSGQVTVVAEGFDTPAAAKFDHQGRLHVADQEAGEVVRVDLATGAKEVVAHLEVGIDNLTFDSHDRLYVSNAHDGSVVRVLPNGYGLPIQRGGLTAPGGAALALHEGSQRLFVSDTYTLRELDRWTGREVGIIHSVLGRPGLSTPLSIGSFGAQLVTTSWFGKVVQVFDPETSAVVATHADFPVPIFATSFGQDLVVSELATHCVWRRPAGTTDRIPLGCGLPVPAGIASDGSDLFVAEWASGNVYQLVQGGATLSPARVVASGLSHPEGLALTPEGALLVVETGTRTLSRIDLATQQKTVVADDLDVALAAPAGYPPTWVFNGVAVDACGVIYVTGDAGSSVTRIIPQSWDLHRCLGSDQH